MILASINIGSQLTQTISRSVASLDMPVSSTLAERFTDRTSYASSLLPRCVRSILGVERNWRSGGFMFLPSPSVPRILSSLGRPSRRWAITPAETFHTRAGRPCGLHAARCEYPRKRFTICTVNASRVAPGTIRPRTKRKSRACLCEGRGSTAVSSTSECYGRTRPDGQGDPSRDRRLRAFPPGCQCRRSF